jgi:hypothetical protein
MVEGKHYVYIVYLDTPEGEEMPLWVGQGTSYRWKAYRKRNFKNKDLRAMVEWCRENNLFDQLRPEKVQYFATRDGALDLEEELIALIGRRDLGTGPLFNRTCGGEEGLSETGRMGGRASDGAGSRTRWASDRAGC